MAGEITMSKHNHQRGSSVSMALAGMTVLAAIAGCDGERTNNAVKAERRDHTSPELVDAGHASVAEARHFDVYNRYRMMFDDVADSPPPYVRDHRSDIRPALDVHKGIRSGMAMRGCFLVNGAD